MLFRFYPFSCSVRFTLHLPLSIFSCICPCAICLLSSYAQTIISASTFALHGGWHVEHVHFGVLHWTLIFHWNRMYFWFILCVYIWCIRLCCSCHSFHYIYVTCFLLLYQLSILVYTIKGFHIGIQCSFTLIFPLTEFCFFSNLIVFVRLCACFFSLFCAFLPLHFCLGSFNGMGLALTLFERLTFLCAIL